MPRDRDDYTHPMWQRKRLEIMQRDGFSCVACKATDRELNVHHIEYHDRPWICPDDKMQTLCRDCHAALGEHKHGGLEWHREEREGVIVRVVEVHHCPRCGSKRFRDKGGYVKCAQCAVSPDWLDWGADMMRISCDLYETEAAR